VHEHSLYEDLLSECKDAAEIEDWANVQLIFDQLVTHLKRHVALEEGVLYPAYETAPHAPQGPTTALREEHSTIISLFRDLAAIINTRDSEHMLESLAYLENRMIKHHEKEEDIFLPMASHILNDRRDELLRKLDEFGASNSGRKWPL
jgi:iron-sulfur cluster repair protein YtfE (RIC family)